ncbi:Arginine--pyruvate transaminase AruH like protein [Verticillium longisporum]|nr:Arginine--pyruvate transaminase AruH like protein [Verticillium longisporum]
MREARQTGKSPIDTSTCLVYGAIPGSEALRSNIASQHENLSSENVLITQGAIAANFLTLYTLVGPGDHVICVYPTYQQLYSVPQSLGADVTLWKLKAENGFVPDVAELEALVRPNTKMIIINNPNNPTGASIPRSVLAALVDTARARDITILSDEVYRPLFHDLHDDDAAAAMPPSITGLGYDKVIATGSMSKAYALAGIRIGWIASPNAALLARLALARDYTTISVSQLDDQVATYALAPAVRTPLLRRNVALARTNRALVEAFVDAHAGNGEPVDDVAFAKDVLDKTKVFFVPGSKCFGDGEDFKGYVRIGSSIFAAAVEGPRCIRCKYIGQSLGHVLVYWVVG